VVTAHGSMVGTILREQSDELLERSGGGLGLGLSLVQRLVELHRGSVRAESAGEGRGSRFTVRLPLAEEALETAEAPQAPAPPPVAEPAPRGGRVRAGEKPAVLVVEDNEDARDMLALLLEGRGFAVGTAADGQEGVDKAASGSWDVAVVDIGLPGLDGYEVARRVRAAEGGRDLVLIALSGYGRPEDLERSREAGFDRHLVKPVDPGELFALLESL
jgi:CheY-like chemotaxis protein